MTLLRTGAAAKALALLLLIAAGVFAQSPSVLSYRGRVEVDGKPFNGTGLFTFAILDANGIILWSSGEFPFVGKTNVPPTALRVSVQAGEYSVRLGDTATGAAPIDMALLRRSIDPRLRIWFHDGKRGWNTAGADVSLSATLLANSAPSPTAAGAGADTDAILRELRELRAKVDRQNVPAAPAREVPRTVTVPLGKSPSIGRADAPLVLVEFTDFQCGFCKRFDDTTFPELKKNFVDTGKLRIVSRSLPLPFHTNAGPAAVAALCANDQQQFWHMREKLFADIGALSRSNYLRLAAELKLDGAAFGKCLDANTYAAQVAADAKDAGAVGINGTPSFVLGKLNGEQVTGLVIVGAQPYATFEAEITKQLGGAK